MDIEDEVVGTLPVTLARSQDLWALQYPLRSTSQPDYSETLGEVSSARWKPLNRNLEIELGDDGFTLEGSAIDIPDAIQYSMIRVQHGSIIIAPVAGVVRMRPKMATDERLVDPEDEEEEHHHRRVVVRAKSVLELPVSNDTKRLKSEEEWVSLDLVDDKELNGDSALEINPCGITEEMFLEAITSAN